jgi:hypothetical protein
VHFSKIILLFKYYIRSEVLHHRILY